VPNIKQAADPTAHLLKGR